MYCQKSATKTMTKTKEGECCLHIVYFKVRMDKASFADAPLFFNKGKFLLTKGNLQGIF